MTGTHSSNGSTKKAVAEFVVQFVLETPLTLSVFLKHRSPLRIRIAKQMVTEFQCLVHRAACRVRRAFHHFLHGNNNFVALGNQCCHVIQIRSIKNGTFIC